MKRSRNVKILATLGPASLDEAVIERLFLAGADVFRINMSHTSHENLHETVAKIRRVEKKLERPIGILADLQGPKLRLGTFAQNMHELQLGQKFTLDQLPIAGDVHRVFLPHEEIFTSVKPGERLLIDDGRLELLIDSCQQDADGYKIHCHVVAGSRISDRKGVSLPDTNLAMAAMTEKDHDDLQVILQEEVDWLALSFVQRPQDIIAVRQIVGDQMAILSKIEKPQALNCLDEIIELSDALMVARGDLGVEMPLETVPGTQMAIIRACRAAGKPVVVATQMLESMVSAAVPTRAEVSDVATAVYEGADAIMLSAESASGSYPIEAVEMMNRIAVKIECDDFYAQRISAEHPKPENTSADAISLAARQIAETLNLSAIVAYTETGATAIRASRERPHPPILALSPRLATARRLSLVWGLHCVVSEGRDNPDDMVEQACQIAQWQGFCQRGESIIITAGVPFGIPGTTNMLRIAETNC